MTNTMRGVVKSRYSSRTASLAQVLPDVKAKLAGIWGELDGTTHPYTQERADLIRSIQPDAPFRVIPNSGHWVQYETPEAFDATLLELVRGHGSGAASMRYPPHLIPRRLVWRHNRLPAAVDTARAIGRATGRGR